MDIVYSYVEADTAMIDAVVAQKAKGLVWQGRAPAPCDRSRRPSLTALSKLPASDAPVIVRSSRVGNGRVLGRPEYDEIGMLPGRQPEPAESAHPADAGADEDDRPEGNPADLRPV